MGIKKIPNLRVFRGQSGGQILVITHSLFKIESPIYFIVCPCCVALAFIRLRWHFDELAWEDVWWVKQIK